MGFKELLFYIELPLCALILIETIAICILFSKRRKVSENSVQPEKGAESAAANDTAAEVQAAAPSVPEPKGYVKGKDAFLDMLTTNERNEFYNAFIYKSSYGLRYKPGCDNGEFFSGAFINLSGVMFVVSDSLMHKICIEYDRVRGLPVAAH